MGKISEYILELGETYEELLNQTGNVEAAKAKMKKLLSKDEFKFFNDHLDIIEENLDFTDGIEGPEDEMTDYMKRRMGDTSYEDEFEKTSETDYMKRRSGDYSDDIFRSEASIDDDHRRAYDEMDDDENIYEARGLKGDVLRPWGGRRARAKMGYGKGNRANFNVEKELPAEEMYDDSDLDQNLDLGEYPMDEQYTMPPISKF